MTIPPRAQLKLLSLPGFRTMIGLALFIIGIVALANMGIAKNLPEPIVILIFCGLLIPTWIGAHYDKKAAIKKTYTQLDTYGFSPCDISELDQDLLDTLSAMKPNALKQSSIRSATTGMVGEHEVILVEHIIGHGRYKQHMISCAVWSPHEWPATIIRPRNLIDRVRSTQDLGDEAFDKNREIKCEQIDTMKPILLPLAHWFSIDKPRAMSIQLRHTAGLFEQWSFDGHWIALADRGQTNARGLIQMTEFLTAFVEELESKTETPATT